MQNLKIYFIIITAFITSLLYAQNDQIFSHNSLAEKIYLQLDNEIYTNNKTIWFKAIISNAVSHESALSSGVLYVDLISFENEIVESKIIKIREGIGNGFFDLRTSYLEGIYQIRAYTEWNKNFNNDFLFTKYIKIFSNEQQEGLVPIIASPVIIDKTKTHRRVTLNIHPKSIDRGHTKDLQVVLNYESTVDSISLNQGINEEYTLDYMLPKSSGLVTLNLKTKNGINYSTSFSADPSYLDLQFFPEGGDLIDGFPSKIGFKAIDVNGKGKYVRGEVIDEDKLVIAKFKSNRLGMGSIEIDEVDQSKIYTAVLRDSSDNIIKTTLLPEVKRQGYTLRVLEHRDNILVVIRVNSPDYQELSLKGISRGYEYFTKRIELIDGAYTVVIPKSKFPNGVIAFTLLEDDKNPVSERLFFNRSDIQIDLSVVLDKNKYQQREKVTIELDTKYQNTNISTSILVVEKENLGEIYDHRENILSYFLLSSDLKGSIESPGAYFKENTDLEIDDLMLTQGWKKYKYTSQLGKLNYKLERKLSVKGVVNSKIATEELDLLLMVFDEKPLSYIKKISAPGSFNFTLEDIYGADKDFVIKTLKDDKNLKIALSKEKPLSIDFEHQSNILNIKTRLIEQIVRVNHKEQYKTRKFYEEFEGNTELNEVYLEGYNLTPAQKSVTNRFGKPNAVIDGKDIRKNKNNWSTGLFSELRNGFQDKIIVTRGVNGSLFIETGNGGKDHVTLIVVDGIPVNKQDISEVQYMLSEEILSVEIIDYPKGFKDLYAQIYSMAPPGILYGSVIAIYTKAGKGLYGALKAKKEINVFSTPVFAIEKDFYIPKYKNLNSLDWSNPDYRNLIYWKPNIYYDKNGKANLSFYNSDTMGDFLVVLETISSTGQINYKELTYTVIKNEMNN